MGKYVRTFFVAAVPGVLMGYLLYTLHQIPGWTIVAFILAGFLLAIPTGMLYYLRAEVEKTIEGEISE